MSKLSLRSGRREVPAALQVTDQAVGLVLRGDRDAANAGVERVRQREVDDARLAAEIDRGLRAPVGELEQAAAPAAGEHVGHGVAREGRRNAELLRGFHLGHLELRQALPPPAAGGLKTRNKVAQRRQRQGRRGGKPVRRAAPPP